MPDVGIQLKMTENVSSIAPKVSSALRGISDAGDELKAALDLGDMEQKYKAFAERVDKVHQMQQARGTAGPAAAVPTPPSGVAAGSILQGGTSLIRGAGRTATALGSGDIGAGANDALGTMSMLAKSAGPIGVVVAALGAIVFAGNALSKQYEKHMTSIMNINSQLDRFGDTAQETGQNFGNTMNEISSAASWYGYTLDEGMNIYRQLIKESGGAEMEEAKDIMYFQRYGGFDPSNLTQFRGKGSRFGMGGQELLGRAYGTMRESGMEKGFFSEFMSSTLSIFEDGISRGVVRGFDEINELQSRIGGMGAQFQGQYGLNLLKTMDTRAAGATGLQSQGDLIMFNAARDMLSGQGKATDYISVQKALEGGMTQDLLGSVYKQIRTRSGGVQPDMIELLKELMPTLTYTTAEILLNELESGGVVSSTYLAPGTMMRGTDEMQLLMAEEEIANAIRNVGKVALRPKAGFIRELAPGIGGLKDWSQSRFERRTNEEANRKLYSEWGESTDLSAFSQNLSRAGYGAGGGYSMNPAFEMGPDIADIMENQSAYPSRLIEDIKKLGFMMEGMGEESLDFLSRNQFLDKIMEEGKRTLSEGETREGEYSKYDLGLAINLLVEMIKEFNTTVKEEKQINIENIMETTE